MELDHDSRMALFAHCVAFTINAVRLPSERRPRAVATADRLADAVLLDITAHWAPTVRSYLGRVTKTHILDAVREAVSIEAADRMADMKKQDMAEAAEQALVGTGWLPVLMRTPRAAQEPAEYPQADAVTETNLDAYSVAAEGAVWPGPLMRSRLVIVRSRDSGRAPSGWRQISWIPRPPTGRIRQGKQGAFWLETGGAACVVVSARGPAEGR